MASPAPVSDVSYVRTPQQEVEGGTRPRSYKILLPDVATDYPGFVSASEQKCLTTNRHSHSTTLMLLLRQRGNMEKGVCALVEGQPLDNTTMAFLDGGYDLQAGEFLPRHPPLPIVWEQRRPACDSMFVFRMQRMSATCWSIRCGVQLSKDKRLRISQKCNNKLSIIMLCPEQPWVCVYNNDTVLLQVSSQLLDSNSLQPGTGGAFSTIHKRFGRMFSCWACRGPTTQTPPSDGKTTDQNCGQFSFCKGYFRQYRKKYYDEQDKRRWHKPV